MILSMLKYIIMKKRIPQKWKIGKIILIYNKGDENNPGNWRTITLTSIFYRIIFKRIAQVIMDMEDCPMKRSILSMSQKAC
jgi:hypothetical protein